MDITLSHETDYRGTPYRSLVADIECSLAVNIRQYPQKTYLSYTDDRDNPSSGADLDDCIIGPTIVIDKVPNWLFNTAGLQYITRLLSVATGEPQNLVKDEANEIFTAWKN